MKHGISKYLGALLMGTAMMTVTSCTDTWNEHYNATDDSANSAATETLWELLEQNPELSRFKAIAEKAVYYKDEEHPSYTTNENNEKVPYTFKDILSAPTPLTVWAPANSALTEQEWADLEAMAENDAYNLQQQFMGNHIALFRKNMTRTGSETIKLINNKFASLDYDNATIQGCGIFKDAEGKALKDIAATNGLLNVIDKKNDFFYNLYEYIKYSGEVPSFGKYLVARDTTYFLESASIEGLPDENGNPTYVDSVYFKDNLMCYTRVYNPTTSDAEDGWMSSVKMLNASINTEDSAIVMIVPTDVAWESATNMLAPYYNYTTTYPDMSKTILAASSDKTVDIYGARRGFVCGKGYETVDSLQTVNIEMDITSPLAFNLSSQPQVNGEVWTMEKFINGGYRNCEYLLNTQGDTIRDVYEEVDGVKTLVFSKNDLFEGPGVKEMKKMSNGYAIITDKWNFSAYYYKRDIDFDANVYYVYDKDPNVRTNEYEINNSLNEDWIDQFGRCREQSFLYVSHAISTSNPWIAVPLYGNKNFKSSFFSGGNAYVMSGKYDVYFVMVPDWYRNVRTIDTEEVPDMEDPTWQAKVKKNKLICTLYYWDESLIGKSSLKYDKQIKITSDEVVYEGLKVDTLLVMSDVEFPYSYQNLLVSYPVMKIESKPSNSDVKSGGFSRAFCIDRIILKSKETE